eukprot:scaffold338696_cov38-Prasinocladus_malaysianus.AAC.2
MVMHFGRYIKLIDANMSEAMQRGAAHNLLCIRLSAALSVASALAGQDEDSYEEKVGSVPGWLRIHSGLQASRQEG